MAPLQNEVFEDADLLIDQQVPQFVPQFGALGSIIAGGRQISARGGNASQSPHDSPFVPTVHIRPLYDDNISINVVAPKEIRGIRDYLAK